jgi:hypothetical protein
METVAEHCERIVTALEDLVAQEGAAVASRDFNAMLALQERTAPLVDFLVAKAPAASGSTLRNRIFTLHDRRRQNGDALAAEIERTRAELQQMENTRRRVAQIAPVYGQPGLTRGQWQAVG